MCLGIAAFIMLSEPGPEYDVAVLSETEYFSEAIRQPETGIWLRKAVDKRAKIRKSYDGPTNLNLGRRVISFGI